MTVLRRTSPLWALLLTPVLANAQGASIAQPVAQPTDVEIMQAAQEARAIVAADRKELVKAALDLTEQEAAAFWPVYDRYMADLGKARDRRVKLILDFAGSYDSMTDATANKLIDDALRYEQQVLDVRKKYVKQARKLLPATKAARFYQIENKLDAIGDFVLADEIPLIR
ncbi:MAG: hypothetical protein MUC71_01630 [Steroidobacteraceae bacterium]|jgi:hypothetical protein|nr:hypothetical protein [Steroidobacteraceae bacterium]